MKLLKQSMLIIVVLCACFLPGAKAFGAADNSTKTVFLTATQLADKIRTNELTSVQVVEAFLAQIDAHNPALNGIVTLDREGALKRAREADAALAAGMLWGPLHGVPVTIKDAYATSGLKTTSGYGPLADYVPDFDATSVSRLKNAGAIILGKTNVPVLGLDIQTNNPIFGRTNNPWNIEYTPGGSTGGGAAAVAAGMSPLELCGDTGGSTRIPAHFCGLFGIKATEHLISEYGKHPGMSGINANRNINGTGFLARSIDDLKLCLPIISGQDTKDVNVPPVPMVEPAERSIQDLRIAWTDDFERVPVTAETQSALQSLVSRLEAAGCLVEKTQPDDFDIESAWLTWGEILGMQIGVNLEPALRAYIYLITMKPFADIPMQKRMYEPMTVKKYMEAMQERDALITSLEEFLAEWDVWVCPVSSTPAFKHMEPAFYSGPSPVYIDPMYVDEQELNYTIANFSYTVPFNVTGSPVVIIPIGYTKEGLPLGVQIVGRRWKDMELLHTAGLINDAVGAFKNPPGY